MCTESRTSNQSEKSPITKNFNVGNFSAIEAGIVGNIIFTQPDATSVIAEGDKELVNRLIVTVEDDELKLSLEDNSKIKYKNRKPRLTVMVSSPNLYKIDSDGVGNISLDGVVKRKNCILTPKALATLQHHN